MTSRPHIAAIRFGLGLRLGEAAPRDPESWLLGQLSRADAPLAGPSGAEALRVLDEPARTRQLRLALQAPAASEGRRVTQEVARARLEAQGMQLPPRAAPGDPATAEPLAVMLRADALAWAEHRLASTTPFADRLADFWANHFTVSRRKVTVGGLAGPFEREAIRPHLNGRFADMLLAATRHPAMLLYLDNVDSIGPNSPEGRRSGRGLNENLAREVLELHTLSREGGYTQQDVQELAKILTGWSVRRTGEPHGFLWREDAHEPGTKTLLGRRFAEGAGSQEEALCLLATHPATYRHLALKLARHFVADEPPARAVAALEETLRRTEGDLAAVHRRLVTLPDAWEAAGAKFRTPRDLVLAAGRAVGLERGQPILSGMGELGQPLWQARQPDGWPDRMQDWAGPEALMRRADWAYTFTGRLGRVDLSAAAEAALGPLGRAETLQAMRRAGSVRDALTLLLCSPEFQFR
ncbi:DUF1800 domain-containing protein [Rubritepida flocculans]|jgi:uncharacterized protein (DUF1800 family)|uniref:DUF1800 domain-containing protein n=1 Tax=Rubritepida flocculans TaxID=182403 RepID=UPI000487FF9F|nr:DUF1800 domain-containing protein [Rubritepida flocculans]